MAELANCTRCDKVFVKTIRDICQECYKQEEKDFQTVYRFLKKQVNREATLMEVVEATGVEEKLIIKFIKERRLHTTQFPKLAYPCENCGANIVSGKLCSNCSQGFLSDLEKFEKEEHEKQSKVAEKSKSIYYTIDKHKK
ncbi:flagellar operon protein TIGR03826 [Oceanobacillus limi]|uniref:Flagellar operon protein TIGR03826 n=1 Tax=Oceanobacillus limi TaxID=930131 RepID=A0A1I0BR74_9BACI|nr:TIGR03826 family flagellar region protein [Oceanobacillus limi]SET09404.1 flagellar operon protein TIGR03826 [Oceanobacillus limi]